MTYRGRHFSPSLSGDRYLKLGSKSDHQTEISWNIVQYDALVPRPEGLRCLYFVFECAVGKKNMQIKSAKHRELLLVLVSFFGHEKGGIYNRSEFIMSTDKPNLGVCVSSINPWSVTSSWFIYNINSIVNTSLMQCVH